jgi:hypothetical protein
MTEAEWLASADPRPMLEFVRDKVIPSSPYRSKKQNEEPGHAFAPRGNGSRQGW